jgi:hypothetical protein
LLRTNSQVRRNHFSEAVLKQVALSKIPVKDAGRYPAVSLFRADPRGRFRRFEQLSADLIREQFFRFNLAELWQNERVSDLLREASGLLFCVQVIDVAPQSIRNGGGTDLASRGVRTSNHPPEPPSTRAASVWAGQS